MGKIVGLTSPKSKLEEFAETKPIVDGETIAPVEEEKPAAHSKGKKAENKAGE